MVALFGVRALVFLYELILSKFTIYISNVVVPQRPGQLCGVSIRNIYFTTAPLDWGLSFNFLSYNGQITLCCTADDSKVAQPQAVVDSAKAFLAELTESIV